MLRNIVLSAILAGLGAGLVLTGVQRLQVVPLIQQAERYETAGDAAHHEPPLHADGAAHDHGTHDHGAGAWSPAKGLERTAFTALANVSTGIGFGLLLCAVFAWRGRVSRREGVLWGLAGFTVFFVNPAFGLPPELPGTFAAALESRQIWWLATVGCTGAGIALLAFRRTWPGALGGALLIGLPHLVGAPVAEHAGGLAPPALEQAFLAASYVANGTFWVALGLLSAWSIGRLMPRDALPAGPA